MNIWSIGEPTYRLVGRIVSEGEVIEAENDDEEDWEVPSGHVTLVVQLEVTTRRRDGTPYTYAMDCFGFDGTPKELWNALGRLQQALPEKEL